MPNTTVSIDSGFKALCEPQTEEELALLRDSIKTDGCRDKVLFWKAPGNPIVDGMTRFEICLDEEIDFDVQPIEFSTRGEAECWILQNQLGRRNLTDAQRAIALGRLYKRMKPNRADNLLGGILSGKNCAVNLPPTSTAAQIGAKFGVSGETVKRDGKLAEAVEKITPAAKTQIAGTKVENNKADLKRLADLPPKQQEKVATLIGAGKAETVTEGLKIAGIDKPKQDQPTDAACARAQIKVWYDTIGRWLRQSPSIDEYRGKWPGAKGDAVVKAATKLYEALKLWEKGIK